MSFHKTQTKPVSYLPMGTLLIVVRHLAHPRSYPTDLVVFVRDQPAL